MVVVVAENEEGSHGRLRTGRYSLLRPVMMMMMMLMMIMMVVVVVMMMVMMRYEDLMTLMLSSMSKGFSAIAGVSSGWFCVNRPDMAFNCG